MTDELVFERLPNDEYAWLRPDFDTVEITDAARRALAMSALFDPAPTVAEVQRSWQQEDPVVAARHDVWLLQQRPNTNGYTESEYQRIKGTYEHAIYSPANEWELKYAEEFDTVADEARRR